MKQVSLREFSLHPTKYINKLPVILTRYNIPVASVIPYSSKYKGISLQKEVDDTSAIFINNSLDATQPLLVDEPGTSKWPTHNFGKPLSGTKQNCPVCHESVPVEFAQQHYAKSHGDI